MLPEHSPFSTEQRLSLDALFAQFNPTQTAWLAGYLSASPSDAVAPAAAPTPSGLKLTILYGSESGNSEKLADLSAKEAKKRGFKTAVKNMADITPADLIKIENLLVIVSTWGEGDPPETATAFHKQLMTETLSLPKLRYSVCALGDTSYTQFCQIGKEVDARLETFGATRISPRQDCDLEYEEPHLAWLEKALTAFGPADTQPAASVSVQVVSTSSAPAAQTYGKKNPCPAELLERVLLTSRGSAKETWHYEISLDGSGFTYQPGDALAVVPVNAPDIVEGMLAAANLTGTESVDIKDRGNKPLEEALRQDLDLTGLSRPVLTKLQALTQSAKLAELLADDHKDDLKNYLWGRWVADAIRDFAPKALTAAELVAILRKLPPRLYSIASSPLAHPGEVHLTVASVRYSAHGVDRKGVASTYLADMVASGDQVPVYMHENKNFRLPSSADTPVIMVGPGTGIAPFRAFVEHRAALEQSGKSWLFFGDQHYTYDFLYQLEWQEHLKNGALTKLDVAFSRDQPEKVYVQDRLRANAKEVYSWLQDGAHFYVCGDASRMAADVHEALISIFETEGGKSREDAEIQVEELKKSKRYQRDVY